MTQWDETIENHHFHTVVSSLKELLADYSLPDDQTKGREAVLRVEAILQFLETSLKAVDPVFLSSPQLNQLQKHVTSIQNELTAFSSDNNENHFTTVHNSLDTLLTLASRLPTISIPEDASGLIETAKSFRQQAEDLISGLRARVGTAKGEISALDSQTQQVREELESTREVVNAQKTRLDTAISDFQGQFSEAEDRRRQTFDQSMQQFSETLAQAVAQQGQRLEQLIDDFDKKADGTLEALEQKRKEAIDLVHVIGNVGVTGNFKEVADSEKRAADYLRIVALVFMTLIVVGVALTIKIAVDPEADWQQIAIRIGITLALAVPAAYTARESIGHRKIERATRRYELELASLDPYLEKLPEDQRNEVKKQLSERFFGVSGGGSNVGWQMWG